MAGKFEIKKTEKGKYKFSLKAGNGQIILDSELYETKASAENGIESVKKNAADDKRFERRTSAKNQPYFVLKAGNGQIIGQSEMYNSESALENGIKSVQTNAANAEIVDTTGA